MWDTGNIGHKLLQGRFRLAVVQCQTYDMSMWVGSAQELLDSRMASKATESATLVL